MYEDQMVIQKKQHDNELKVIKMSMSTEIEDL